MVQSPEQNRERAKAWGRANPERNRARAKAWNEQNPDRVKANYYKRGSDYYRNSSLKCKFGITPEDYDAMLEAQGGGCAICGGVNDGGRRLAVDHDHDSKVVRGLLCGSCNNGLGRFGDDVARLERAADYLRLPALSGVC